MKKVISLILMVLMGISLLTACGAGQPPKTCPQIERES